MATRFMCKALLTAALGIALSPLLAATATGSPTWSNTPGALQLDPPAAPSNCKTRTRTWRDGKGYLWSFTVVSWRDNSSNEDGFIVEEWRRNQAGAWALGGSVNVPANSTWIEGNTGPNFKYRVKAFNASGDSSWSNWAR